MQCRSGGCCRQQHSRKIHACLPSVTAALRTHGSPLGKSLSGRLRTLPGLVGGLQRELAAAKRQLGELSAAMSDMHASCGELAQTREQLGSLRAAARTAEREAAGRAEEAADRIAHLQVLLRRRGLAAVIGSSDSVRTAACTGSGSGSSSPGYQAGRAC